MSPAACSSGLAGHQSAEPKLRAPCLQDKYSTTRQSPQLLLEDCEKWLKFICVWWRAHMSWHPWEGEWTRTSWNSHDGSRFSLIMWVLGLGRGVRPGGKLSHLLCHLICPWPSFTKAVEASTTSTEASTAGSQTGASWQSSLCLHTGTADSDRVLRRCQLIAPHPSRHHCPVPGGLAPRSRERGSSLQLS